MGYTELKKCQKHRALLPIYIQLVIGSCRRDVILAAPCHGVLLFCYRGEMIEGERVGGPGGFLDTGGKGGFHGLWLPV